MEKSEVMKSEKMKSGPENDKEKSGQNREGNEEATGDAGLEVDGDAVPTAAVPRGKDSSYHTRFIPRSCEIANF